MNTDPESIKLPAHYGSVRQLIGKIIRGYFQSIDATIRLIGAGIICAILHAAIWAGLNAISSLLLGGAFGEGFILVMTWMISPVFIRVGLLGGGFLIPPIFSSKGNQTAKTIQNKSEMATPMSASD